MKHLIVTALIAGLLTACSTVDSLFDSEPEKILEGERIAIMSSAGDVDASTTLDDVGVSLPTALAPEAWPQKGGNVQHHVDHVAMTSGNSQSSNAGDGSDWSSSLIASPVVHGDAVFAMDASGVISAHARDDISSVLWRKDTLEDDDTLLIGGGLAAGDDQLYAAMANGKVASMDIKTGDVLWERELKTPVRSAPAVENGIVLVITVDSQLYALDGSTGGILWRHRGIQESASLLGTVIPAVANERVVVAYPSGEIYTIALRDGKVLWTDSLILPQRTIAMGTFTGVGGDPVIVDTMVYTVSHNGILAANDLTSGLRIWEQPISSNNTPWVSGDFMFVVTPGRKLVAVYRRDGRIKWVSDIPAGDDDAKEKLTGPFVVNGQVIVFGSMGEQYAFSPEDGSLTSTQDTPDGYISAPAFAGGGMYYIDQGATLHLLR